MNRAYKFRIYPNKEQRELLDKTFGCCRFIYNKMLEERKTVYEQKKNDKKALNNYKYKTEKQYKQEYEFLKEVDSKALQSEWRNLQSAFRNFFNGLKKGRKVGFPKFKSRKTKQTYTTFSINNNCKIDFEKRKIKFPKINTWINYRDDRIFIEEIKHITVSKNRSGKYHASIVIERESSITPRQELEDNKIIGFDMSAPKFLIAKEIEFVNPRFYRMEQKKLKKLHRELSRKQKGSSNNKKSTLKLAKLYNKINNRKKDWMHKVSHLLSEHFDCVILEDLNIKGMQHFNSGLSKSVTLDFSWNFFVNILRYKMEQKGKYLILIDRYFPSSKICSVCGYVNNQLRLDHRKWTCPECNIEHNRDINASINIRSNGLEILKGNHIKIIKNNDRTVGTTEFAFGEDVRLINQQFLRKKEATCL